MLAEKQLSNFINNRWSHGVAGDSVEVINPATGELIAEVPLGGEADVSAAVAAAAAAFPEWRRTPPEERIQHLFKLKQLLEEHIEEIARLVTLENGKTLTEARAEIRRGIENVEVACGIPVMMQGYNLEDVARGIDEFMIRQPLGVVAAITPFNFPVMTPLWFLPYAVACGNTFILKPSERVPVAIRRVFELVEAAGFPAGVVTSSTGRRRRTCACSTTRRCAPSVRRLDGVARYIYARGRSGQARPVPGRGEESRRRACRTPTWRWHADRRRHAFGCAGQRCRRRLGRGHGRRGGAHVPRRDHRHGGFAQGRLRA